MVAPGSISSITYDTPSRASVSSPKTWLSVPLSMMCPRSSIRRTWRSAGDDESELMGLTFVPTPLGNLRDITLRALDALREAELIVAEDTRVARKLLSA